MSNELRNGFHWMGQKGRFGGGGGGIAYKIKTVSTKLWEFCGGGICQKHVTWSNSFFVSPSPLVHTIGLTHFTGEWEHKSFLDDVMMCCTFTIWCGHPVQSSPLFKPTTSTWEASGYFGVICDHFLKPLKMYQITPYSRLGIVGCNEGSQRSNRLVYIFIYSFYKYTVGG